MKHLASLALLGLLLAPRAENTLPPRGTIEEKEQKTLRTHLTKFMEAREKGAEKEMAKQREEIGGLLKKLAADKNVGDALRCVDDWSDVLRGLPTFKRANFNLPREQTVEIRTQDGTELRIKYVVAIPKAYDPARAWPLLICLPPKDTKDVKKFLTEQWGKTSVVESMIVVMLDPKQEEKVKKAMKPVPVKNWGVATLYAFFMPFKEVRSEFNVDENRVYLDGFGEAGEGAFELGSLYADLFAGVIVRSALPTPRTMIPNFRNLPVLMLVGEKDGVAEPKVRDAEKTLKEAQADVTVKIAPGKWTELTLTEAPALIQWMEIKKRNPYPDEIVWETWDRAYDRCYWLSIVEMESSLDPAKPLSKKVRVKARVVRAPSGDQLDSIQIEAVDVNKVRLSFNDRFVNLDKAFNVLANGETVFSGKKERSLEHLLDAHARSGRDPSWVYVNSVEVTIPAKKK